MAGLQAQGRTPRIVLTGGTIAAAAYERIDADSADWANVDFWFGDERFVPEGHADRNDQQARDAFLDRVGATRVHSVAGNDCALSAAEVADQYAATLPDEPFDVVLLGMGPDGHVASLFPHHPQLHETDRDCIELFDSPKPPAVRISMTFPALNHAESVWFLVSGERRPTPSPVRSRRRFGGRDTSTRRAGLATDVVVPRRGRGQHRQWLISEHPIR